MVAVAIQGCGRCATCRAGLMQLCPQRVAVGLSRDGGMAEYAVMPEQHLVPVPEGLDLSVAALGEPLSVAVHAVDVRADIEPGQNVSKGRTVKAILVRIIPRDFFLRSTVPLPAPSRVNSLLCAVEWGLYSPKCLEEVFSEVHIQDPA